MGAIKKTLFLNNLKDMTCIITEIASITKTPPITKSNNSCFVITAVEPKTEPNDSEPVSPINIFAGGTLNQRKPKQLPIREKHKTLISPADET
jgi:hypothetical protein